VIVGVFVAGCSGNSQDDARTRAYLTTVCSALSPVNQDFLSFDGTLQQMRTKNLHVFKQGLEGELSAMEQDAHQTIPKIEGAGAPDVPNGRTIAAGALREFVSIDSALARATRESNALPTASQRAFARALVRLGLHLKLALAPVARAGRSLATPELVKVERTLPECRSLGGLS
jgi:hypothetical protein